MNMKNIDDNIDELVEMSKGRSELNNKSHREEEVKDMLPLFGPSCDASSAEEWSRMASETSLADFLDE